VETVVSRYKTTIGGTTRNHTMPSRKTEAAPECTTLNKMTHLGMPDGYGMA